MSRPVAAVDDKAAHVALDVLHDDLLDVRVRIEEAFRDEVDLIDQDGFLAARRAASRTRPRSLAGRKTGFAALPAVRVRLNCCS